MASIKDVAKRAGVSTATVSRVLSNKNFIKPDTRERVLKAVSDLRYRPNLVARSLRVQRSARIGLVFSDIRNPFFAALSRAVEDAAYERGFSVLICNTDEDPQKEAMYLNLLQDENVAGIIFSPTQTFSTKPSGLNPEIPVVIIDRPVAGRRLDTVVLDNKAAAFELTNHMLENGYRRLAGLFGDASVTGRERALGFQQALEGLNLEPFALRFIPPRTTGGYIAAREIITGSICPEGLVASNALLTAGAFQAIHERRMRIPVDIALAGFDLTEWGAFVDPQITVIEQPVHEIGCSAMELLFRRIQQPGRAAQRIVLKGKLVPGGSSAPR